jgi:hypothetical protein
MSQMHADGEKGHARLTRSSSGHVLAPTARLSYEPGVRPQGFMHASHKLALKARFLDFSTSADGADGRRMDLSTNAMSGIEQRPVSRAFSAGSEAVKYSGVAPGSW